MRRGVAGSTEALHLEVASRTDRGVHARANVLALSSEREPPVLLRALNGIGADLWFTGVAPVTDAFRVRSARHRWYRYLEPRERVPVPAYRRAAREFRGPVDVRSFGRGMPSAVATTRRIDSVTIRAIGRWVWIDVRAPSFVHGMVRKMVSAIRAVADGELGMEELRAGIAGRRRLALPLAEPDRLVLWEVDLGLTWTDPVPPGTRRQVARLARERHGAAVRAAILDGLDPSGGLASERVPVRRRIA